MYIYLYKPAAVGADRTSSSALPAAHHCNLECHRYRDVTAQTAAAWEKYKAKSTENRKLSVRFTLIGCCYIIILSIISCFCRLSTCFKTCRCRCYCTLDKIPIKCKRCTE